MIIFHYPPVGSSSGVLRSLKFSNYLLKYNWQPYILTVKENFFNVTDPILLEDISKEVIISRTTAFDFKKLLSFRGKSLNMFSFPDKYIGWLPFALVRGLRIIRENKIDIIFSTSPIPTAHLIALTLSKLTKIPWIADFRDPWIEEIPEYKRSSFRQKLERYLEYKVIQNANRIITTTNSLKNDFLERYKNIERSKFITIYNGYDSQDFGLKSKTDSRSHSEKFIICHLGLLNDTYRNPLPLLSAINKLINENKNLCNQISLKLYGESDYLNSREFKNILRDMKLEGVVECPGQITHQEAIKKMHESDLLLVIQAGEDTRSLIPAKTFEYMQSNKPILALTLEGETANLIRELNAGVVIHPEDVNAIKNEIFNMFQKYKSNGLHVRTNKEKLKNYERKALTEQLSDVLNLETEIHGN